MKKLYWVVCNKNLEKPKGSDLLEKALVLVIICSKCKNEDEKIFKEEKSLVILKIIRLINNIDEYQKLKSHAWRKHESKI